MQVTDEMVERASHAFRDSDDEVNPACGYWSCLRSALEAALADVPEPDIGQTILRALSGSHVELEKKLYLAEAKLDKVREWSDKHQMGPRMKEDLLAILDEP